MPEFYLLESNKLLLQNLLEACGMQLAAHSY